MNKQNISLSKSDLWQPTDENIYEYFDDKFGLKAWENGKSSEALLDLDKEKFLQFLKSLDSVNKEKLLESLRRYDGSMSAINESHFPYASALQTVVLMGLIEFVMAEKQYIKLGEYLINCLKEGFNVTQDKLKELIESYNKEFGQRNAYMNFFKNHLSENEIIRLLNYLKACPEWESCADIKSFSDQLVNYRHKFVHELSWESLWPYTQKLVLSNGFQPQEIYPTVSPSLLVGIVWRGILRKFGYE